LALGMALGVVCRWRGDTGEGLWQCRGEIGMSLFSQAQHMAGWRISPAEKKKKKICHLDQLAAAGLSSKQWI